jgi:hypothetical protein
MAPIRYTKEHPVAVVTCIAIGMGLAHFGFGLSMIPGVNVRGGAKVSTGDDE